MSTSTSDPAFKAIIVDEKPDARLTKDPPAVAIEKSNDAKWQNIALGAFLTFAFAFDNSFGSKSFKVEFYIAAMLAGFGVVNWVPRLFGKPPGSVGGFALLASSTKVIAAIVGSSRIGGA